MWDSNNIVLKIKICIFCELSQIIGGKSDIEDYPMNCEYQLTVE